MEGGVRHADRKARDSRGDPGTTDETGHDVQVVRLGRISNTGWQRDLSVSHDRLGDVAVAAGDLAAANEHFEIDLRIAETLAAKGPDNAQWTRDVEISRNRLIDLRKGRHGVEAATADPSSAADES
jgi:hypothetical protein